jgi:mRNA-degrading endonuclease RelE of RelBE toxin-antitoxin system
MRTKVVWSSQVEEFVLSQAPEPRRRLRLAIRALGEDAGDIKHLEGTLTGFGRLRVGQYRVVFCEKCDQGERIIECFFMERRAVVYDILNQMVMDGLA